MQLFTDIKSQRDQLEEKLRLDEESRITLTNQLEKFKKESQSLRLQSEEMIAKLRKDLESSQVERVEVEALSGDKDVKIKSLMSTNLELQ